MAGLSNNFRDFKVNDYYSYEGAIKLPNGSKPKICNVDTKDDVGVDIILSGDGAGSTVISMESEDSSYLISIPGYNSCHTVIANSIIEEFNNYENTKEAISGIVSDYDMQRY